MSSSSSDSTNSPPLERFSRSADVIGRNLLMLGIALAAVMVVARVMSDKVASSMPLIPYLLIAAGLIAAPIFLLLAFPPLLADLQRFGLARVWAISSVS